MNKIGDFCKIIDLETTLRSLDRFLVQPVVLEVFSSTDGQGNYIFDTGMLVLVVIVYSSTDGS